jgi:hypothetical protein
VLNFTYPNLLEPSFLQTLNGGVNGVECCIRFIRTRDGHMLGEDDSRVGDALRKSTKSAGRLTDDELAMLRVLPAKLRLVKRGCCMEVWTRLWKNRLVNADRVGGMYLYLSVLCIQREAQSAERGGGFVLTHSMVRRT